MPVEPDTTTVPDSQYFYRLSSGSPNLQNEGFIMLSSVWKQFGDYQQHLLINETDESENRLLSFEFFIFISCIKKHIL
jgi:hypothetical protein